MAFLRLLVVGAVVAIYGVTAQAANRYDPRLRFRTLSTPHFDVHFHQGEDTQARRLAALAEEVAGELETRLGRPDGRVQVILVDQNDLSNGWATPIPYNTIEITAAGPTGESMIGNTDDWLRLVFTHEYTHVVHLGRRRGWIGGLRGVFGRLPVLYPNVFLPVWQIEGIAVFEESARTGGGRIPAPDFRQILERAAVDNRFEPIDRANGGLIDWPSAAAPYVYGGYFHRYLADRYGEESLRRLTDQTARTIPYFGSRAYRKVFGRSLGNLWRDFEIDVRQRARQEPSSAVRVTHHGFNVDAPRFGDDGRIFYSVLNPHGFPSLMELSSDRARDRHVTTRYLGNRTAVGKGVLVFDQLELVNNVGLQSDLYAIRMDGGAAWRLTRGARAGDPDVSPDGTTIVCTLQRNDRREVGTMHFDSISGSPAAPVALVSEPDTDYSALRWSPDGRWIAAERRRSGVASEVVLIDPRTREVRVIAGSASGRSITPAWTPDSSRVLFASDREGGPFRIFSVDIRTAAQLRLDGTGPGSVHAPDVSRDSATIAFVGYTVDGQDVFTIAAAAAEWTPVNPGGFEAKSAPPIDAPAVPTSVRERPYAPWRTLRPTFWTPTVESDNGELVFGAASGGIDALGRQGYAIESGWTVSRIRPDWQAAYAYDRWRPTLFVSASDDTDPWRDTEIRSQEADVGVLVPFRRIRWSHTALAAFNATTDTLACNGCQSADSIRSARRSLRFGWSFDSAKAYGYSISAEEGARITATTELTREALGADGDAGAATIDARGYLRVLSRHAVIAARVGAATAWGDDRVRRIFSAAGAGPQLSSFEFGSDAVALLRGFDDDAVTGRHVGVANIDLRMPLLRIQRGIGTVPLFLRTIHGAVFADVGGAWDDGFDSSDLRLALGAEVSFDTVVGFALPVTMTSGAAWRHDGSGRERGWAVFGRVGRAF